MVSFGQVPSETHVWTSSPIFSTQADLLVHGYVVHHSANVMDSIQIQWMYKTKTRLIQNKYDTNKNQEYTIHKFSYMGAARIFRAAPNVMDCGAAERRKFFQASKDFVEG